VTGLLAFLFLVSANAGTNAVFVDHFANNDVAASDAVNSFWQSRANNTPASTVVEANGELVLTAAAKAGTAVQADVYCQIQPGFNFFTTTLVYNAKFNLAVSGITSEDSGKAGFRIIINDAAGASLTQSSNYFSISLFATGNGTVSSKVDGGSATLLTSIENTALAQEFTLRLDDTNYHLDLICAGGGTSICTAAHGLSAATWRTVGSALTLASYAASTVTTNSTGGVFAVKLSELTVRSSAKQPGMADVSPVVPGDHPSGLLIRSGAAYASLVIPAGAGAAEKYAAVDLQKVLYDITGVALPIATDETEIPGNRVLIGNTRFTGGVVPDAERSGLGKEEYIVRLNGRDMALVGGGPYGTVYAAAELYDILGARWYMPGELGECLPELSEIAFQGLNVRRAPSFQMRWVGNDLQWNMRQRQNHVGINDMSSAFSVEPGIYHTQRRFMPDEYFETHPEYFALVNGERSTNVTSRKLCNGNSEVAQVLAQNMAVYLRESSGVDLISLSPTDGQLWCECGLCTALDEPGVPSDQRYSRRQMVLYNRVATELEKEFPDQKILVGAYNVYTWPPEDPEVTARSNLAVIVTHYEPYCLAHPTADPYCTANQRYLELLSRWREQVSDAYIYEYYLKGNWMGLPWPIVHTIREDIPLLHGIGVKGMYSQYSSDYLWGDFLDQYVAARLLWNHTEDVDAILNEFYPKFYGSAAPAMRKYHELLEAQMAASSACFDGDAPKNWSYVFPEDVLEKMQDYISEAENLAAGGNDLALRRLEKMALLTDYTEKFCRMLSCYDQAKELSGAESAEKYQQALNIFREIDREVLADPEAYEGILDRNSTLYRPMMIDLVAEMETGANAVFADDFVNGSVADSDSETGFWSIETQYNSMITESNGQVNITAARSSTGTSVRSALTSGVDSRFNFFNSTGLTFFADLDLGGTAGTDGDPANLFYRFYLGDAAGQNLNNTPDYFLLQILADGTLQLRRKGNDGVSATLKTVTGLPGLPAQFLLYLNDQDYTLKVMCGDQTNTYTGAHGLTADSWGAEGCSLTFNAQLGGNAPSDADVVMRITDFAVFSGP
jgi:hypothetical protein